MHNGSALVPEARRDSAVQLSELALQEPEEPLDAQLVDATGRSWLKLSPCADNRSRQNIVT